MSSAVEQRGRHDLPDKEIANQRQQLAAKLVRDEILAAQETGNNKTLALLAAGEIPPTWSKWASTALRDETAFIQEYLANSNRNTRHDGTVTMDARTVTPDKREEAKAAYERWLEGKGAGDSSVTPTTEADRTVVLDMSPFLGATASKEQVDAPPIYSAAPFDPNKYNIVLTRADYDAEVTQIIPVGIGYKEEITQIISGGAFTHGDSEATQVIPAPPNTWRPMMADTGQDHNFPYPAQFEEWSPAPTDDATRPITPYMTQVIPAGAGDPYQDPSPTAVISFNPPSGPPGEWPPRGLAS